MSTILIIEDNEDVRENLAEILQLDGYDTLVAENGVVGVEMAKKEKPDLILCDIMMPELDGFGVLKILNGTSGFQNVPFMFLTAKGEKEDFRKGMGLGAADFITKPFDDLELLQAVEIRIKKSQSLRPQVTKSSFFSMVEDDDKTINKVLALAKEHDSRHYQVKDIVYDYSQHPYWLYYIEKGLVKTILNNDSGKELISNLLGQGDFVGLIPVFTDRVYHDQAVVLSEVQMKLISIKDFKNLAYRDNSVMALFLKILANRISFIETQSQDLAYSSVRKKVANALLVYSNKIGQDNFEVLREDLANLAGTAKETLIRTLSDFKKEGLLRINEHSIAILEREELKNMRQ